MTREAFVGALREHLIAYGAQSCAVFSHGPGGEFPNFIVVVRKDGRGKYDPHFSAVLKRRDCTLYARCFKIEVLSGEEAYRAFVGASVVAHGFGTEADLAGGATGCCEAVPLLGSDGAPVTVRDEGPIRVVGGEDKEGRLLLPGQPVTWADIVEGVNEDLSGIENGEGENPKISKNEGLGSKILKVVSAVSSAPSAPRGEALRWDGDNLDAMREFSGVLAIDRGEPMGDCLMVPNGGGSINWGLFNPGCYAIWLEGAKRVRFMDADVFAEEFKVVNEPSEQKISKDSAPAEIRLEGPVTVTTPDGVSVEYPDGMSLDDMAKAGIAKVPAAPKSELSNLDNFSKLVSTYISDFGGKEFLIARHDANTPSNGLFSVYIYHPAAGLLSTSFTQYLKEHNASLYEHLADVWTDGDLARFRKQMKEVLHTHIGEHRQGRVGIVDVMPEKVADQVCGEVFQKTRAAADVIGPWLIEQGATHFRIYELPDKKLAVIALIPCWDTGKSKFDDAIRAANGVVAWMISGTFMAHEKTGYIIGLKRHENYPYIDYVRSGEMAFEHTGTADHGADALRMAVSAMSEEEKQKAVMGVPGPFQGAMADLIREGEKLETDFGSLPEAKKRRLVEGEWADDQHVKMQSDGTTPEELDRQAKETRDPFPGEKPMAEKLEELKNLLETNKRDFNSKREGLGQVPFPPPYAPDNFDMHTLSGTIIAIKTAYNMLADPESAYGRLINIEKVKKLLMVVHDALESREKTEILPYGYNQKQLDLFAAEEAKFQKTIGTWNKQLLEPARPDYDPDHSISMQMLDIHEFILENFDSTKNVWKPEVLFNLNKIRKINFLFQAAQRRKAEAKTKTVHQEIVFNGFYYEWSEINRYRLKTSEFIDDGLNSKIIFQDGRVLHVGECLVIYSDSTFEIKSA